MANPAPCGTIRKAKVLVAAVATGDWLDQRNDYLDGEIAELSRISSSLEKISLILLLSPFSQVLTTFVRVRLLTRTRRR